MTESSVSSPFMTRLRQVLAGSVVVKHRDASMIGLPDCSANWNSRTLWMEFKLVTLSEKDGFTKVQVGNRSKKTLLNVLTKELTLERLCQAVASDSPAQFVMMKKLDIQAWMSLYVVWVKKAKRIVVWNPNQTPGEPSEFKNKEDLAAYIKNVMGMEDSNLYA